MSEILKIIQRSYYNFNAAGAIYALFLVALLYIYLKKDNQEDKKLFFYPSIVCAILVLCPVTAWLIMDFFLGREVYWRIWWLFPILPTVAYVGVQVVISQKEKKYQRVVIIFLSIIIAISGKSIYTSETMRKPENLFKLPTDVLEISDIIAADNNNEEVYIIVSHDLIEYIRLYNPNIKLLYGRETVRMHLGTELQLAVMEQLRADNPDVKVVTTFARMENCEYIVLSRALDGLQGALSENGFGLLGHTNGYSIYKDIE